MLNLVPPVAPAIPARIGLWLLSKMWPIIGIVGVAGCIYLGVSLLVAKGEIRHLGKTIEQRDKTITQLTRDLAQCRTNSSTLQNALDQQNAQLRTLSDQSIAKLDALGRGVDAANRNSASVDQRVRNFLAFNPQGADVCARVLQIDKRFVESLIDERVAG
jgi:hypothetical protein